MGQELDRDTVHITLVCKKKDLEKPKSREESDGKKISRKNNGRIKSLKNVTREKKRN